MQDWLRTPPELVSVGVGVHGVGHRTDLFRLPDLWQLHLYGYAARLVVDGLPYELKPGVVSLIPPATQVQFFYQGRSEHLYAHLRLGTGERGVVVQDAGAETPVIDGMMRQAVQAWAATPARSVAEIWAVLWRIAALRPRAEQGAPVAAAIAHIEANLAAPLTVPQVARAAGISHNHLTRLFRAETGGTVVAYLRRRRLERARHLLRESTLPITAIAAAVGIPDLQAFNKLCRRELGAAPRAIRAG
ncbi:AraC family transcriptional regulator [Nonomuraea sp. NBC_01738]|uniref:AraC family transcriptional regulator n=1 Tax=Nonomuraea sp. NBC_01738 TaxID=2976003 RepID=UPI002E108FAA|nr:AraC family transcriptional regulator [Nonomuraea sp. NBC_01738]